MKLPKEKDPWEELANRHLDRAADNIAEHPEILRRRSARKPIPCPLTDTEGKKLSDGDLHKVGDQLVKMTRRES